MRVRLAVQNERAYGAGAIVSCNPGYAGGGRIECKADGKWTQLPKCSKSGSITCGQLQVNKNDWIRDAHGKSPKQAAPSSPGTTFEVRCRPGHVGSGKTTCLNTSAWSPQIECKPCPAGTHFHANKSGAAGAVCRACPAGPFSAQSTNCA